MTFIPGKKIPRGSRISTGHKSIRQAVLYTFVIGSSQSEHFTHSLLFDFTSSDQHAQLTFSLISIFAH